MKPCRALLVVLTLLLLTAPLHAQTTIYVDDDAPGDPGPGDPLVSDPLEDGSTDDPFDSIWKGILVAHWGDTILLRDGTYTGEGNRDVSFRNRSLTIKSENGPENCIIDCQGSEADPHRAFYQYDHGITSTVEGFTITNGWAEEYGTWSGGGAIRVAVGTLIITGNIFINNNCSAGQYGSAVFCSQDTAAEIIGNVFTNNTSISIGGAISFIDARMVIRDNDFMANAVEEPWNWQGSAIDGWMWDVQKGVSIIGNSFSGHHTGSAIISMKDTETDIVGNTFTDNGLLCMQLASSPSQIRQNLFTGNTGGCVYSRRDLSGTSGSEAHVISNTFTDNSAELGAGVYCTSSLSVIKDNLFSGNHATDSGGAIYISGSNSSVLNNSIKDNSSGGSGGGLTFTSYHGIAAGNRIERNHAGGNGGGMCLRGGSARVINNRFVENRADGVGGGISQDADYFEHRFNTIAGNQAADGGGIYVNTGQYWSTTITDTIIWGNTPNQYAMADAPVAAAHCDVQGGAYGESNIDADPLFTAGLAGEYNLANTAAGQPVDSPCLDSGSEPATSALIPVDMDTSTGTLIELPATDLTTRTDRVGDTGPVDMGYHYTIQRTVSCELACQPSSGVLPFASQFTVSLANDYWKQSRRIQYQLDVTLAGGQYFSSWRRGWQNVQAGQAFESFWGQNLPALSSLAGNNDFLLSVLDVTPPPYNLPPYLPSGDTDTAACVIVGHLP